MVKPTHKLAFDRRPPGRAASSCQTDRHSQLWVVPSRGLVWYRMTQDPTIYAVVSQRSPCRDSIEGYRDLCESH